MANKVYEYQRVTSQAQLNQEDERKALEKKLFRTLKNYSHGYHSNAGKEENEAYDAKVEQLKARIRDDVEHAPEIIAEEFAAHQAKMYRAQMSGVYATLKCNAEWKAIDNVCMALIDGKPFKEVRA